MLQFQSGCPDILKFCGRPIDLLAQLPPRRQSPVTLYSVITDVANGRHAQQWQHALAQPTGQVVAGIHDGNESQEIP